MSASSPGASDRDEQRIVRHYVLVMLVQIVVISALAWIGAAFR